MFDFVLKPVRSFVRAVNEDALSPLEQTEHQTLEAVKALERVTESIEHHVEVIETLATSARSPSRSTASPTRCRTW